MNKIRLKHKFNAKPVVYDGFKFPSTLEGKYYLSLKMAQEAGVVVGFFRQVPLHFPGNIKYVMDFLVFYADGRCEGVEVKGKETAAWKRNQKQIAHFYPWLTLRVVKK